MPFGKNLHFHLRIFFSYALQNLKVKMSYPWDFFANFIGSMAYGVMNILFLWVLLTKTDSIAGWSFAELVFLYGVGELCFGFFSILFFHMVTKLSEYYIVEGHLDRLLLRPLSPLMQLMMENMDMFDLVVLLKGALLIGWSWSQLALDFNLVNAGSLMLATAIGSTVYLGLFLTFTSLSFWFPDRGGLLMPLFSINDVSRYPLNVFPPGIRLFFSYVIPFAFAAFYPTVWVLDRGPISSHILATCLLAALVTICTGLFTFHIGLSRYESTGT